MDPILALLYSYVRVAALYARTGDASYKKTLGQIRLRLSRSGVTVTSMNEADGKIAVHTLVNGSPQVYEFPVPA